MRWKLRASSPGPARRVAGARSTTSSRVAACVPSDLLRQIIEVHAFNPTPIGDELVRAYVPFDELLGNSRTEAALERAMAAGTRVTLVGPTGSGKSSLAEWVLGAPGTYAATRVPVAI